MNCRWSSRLGWALLVGTGTGWLSLSNWVALGADSTDTIRAPVAEAASTDSGAPTGSTTPESRTPESRTTANPIYSRQTTFVIPFTVDSAGTAAREVQLYVSVDRGATWQLYASRRPVDRQFQFRAPRDGDYWFASRTLMANDPPKPVGKLQPEIAVRIDTTPPKVEFAATAQQDGTVLVNWKSSDENFALGSIRIEYQSNLGQPWLPVSAPDAARPPVQGVQEGRAVFVPETNLRAVDVRFEVRDQAGNRETQTRRVFLPKGATRSPAGEIASTPQGPPADPYAIRAQSTARQPIAWPGDNRLADNRAGTTPSDTPAGSATIPSTTSQLNNQSNPQANTLNDQRFKPVTGTVRPPVSQQAASQQAQVGDANGDRRGPPAGETPHVTNSKKFNLDYDLDSVGPSGVKEVELWATRDGGTSWMKWGLDEDKKSPFAVEVEEEGLYGFRMVVVGGTGLASNRPRPGDPADIWVTVDLTMPNARITSAIYGAGEQAGQLDIRWEASDERLATRPIALYYAEKPDGPWQPIATGLANSGQYYWSVPPDVPQEVFLKIEARDDAGNKTSYQVERAVNIEGLAPQGRIRGIRPSEARRPIPHPKTFR